MELKKIKIFVASSIEEYQADRNELGRFVQGLNNRFAKRGIYVELEPCSTPSEMEEYLTRKVEFEEYIKGADFVFFLFYMTLEDYTRQEFETALECFQKNNTPKIFTYFYVVPEQAEISQELATLRYRISDKLQHYYSTYNHIDSIKLGLLLQIAMCSGERFRISFEDNQVLANDIDLMSLDNIPALAKNPEMIRLKKLLAEAEEMYDIELIEELEEKIHKLENKTFEYMRDMYNNIAKGKVDAMLKEAYSCLERGDIAGADRALDKRQIDDMAELVKKGLEDMKQQAKKTIELYSEKIRVQEMQEYTAERIAIIKDCYERIYEIARTSAVGYDEVLNYAIFLDDQNDEMAEELYRQVESFYDLQRNPDKDELIRLYFKLGLLYSEQHRIFESVEKIEKCRAIVEQLVDLDKNKYLVFMANIYRMLGNLCDSQGRSDEAKENYNICVEKAEPLYKFNPKTYGEDLSDIYNDVGMFYKNNKNMEEAEDYYKKSVGLGEMIYTENPILYDGNLPLTYCNLASLYGKMNRRQEEEVYLKKSEKLLKEMYNRNPQRHMESLFILYNKMGAFLHRENRIAAAMKYFKKVLP